MELLAVPNSVMPRAVTASSGGQKRRDDHDRMSTQGQVKPPQAADTRTPESANEHSTAREKGLAGMTALARRIKLTPKFTERSIHKQQEARARLMRDRLQQAYSQDSESSAPASTPKRESVAAASRANAIPQEHGSQVRQSRQSQPIHLVV